MFRDSASAFNHDIRELEHRESDSMDICFIHASAFNQDIGGWYTPLVTDMQFLCLSLASAFNQDIGSWNTEKVTSMKSMFNRSFCVQPRHWKLEHSASDYMNICFISLLRSTTTLGLEHRESDFYEFYV